MVLIGEEGNPSTAVHSLISSCRFCGYRTVSAVPWKTCIFGLKPLYPGYAASTMAFHSAPVLIMRPVAQSLLHTSYPFPAKQPKATPAQAEPAAKTSGYDPSRTLVIIAPDEVPVAKTRSALPLYFASVYFTMETIPRESPPPLCVRVWLEETSQHLSAVLGLSGKMTMNPYVSAR